jgi:hypothetical protein
MSSIKFVPRGERVFFAPENRDNWAFKLKELAELNLPAKSIADAFGCSYQTLVNHEEAMDIVRRGWAAYRAGIEFELRALAYEKIPEDADPQVAAAIKASKVKAIALIHKVLHAAPFVPPVEQERLRRLSDEELQTELKKHIQTNRRVL